MNNGPKKVIQQQHILYSLLVWDVMGEVMGVVWGLLFFSRGGNPGVDWPHMYTFLAIFPGHLFCLESPCSTLIVC